MKKKSRIWIYPLIIMGFAALILINSCEKDDGPRASFIVSPNTAGVGDIIYFQNTSEGANTFDWDFGDGNSSTEENPSHIYTASGNFTILLVATNADGSDEASGVVSIQLWTSRTPMPTARWLHSTSVVDGKIYAIGGGSPPSAVGYSGTESYSTIEEYDPATNIWTTKSGMPTARWCHSTSVVDDTIYVIGGSPSYGFSAIWTLEMYDPTTDTWTRKGDIPRPIINGFTTVVDGKIYAIGGESGNGQRVDEYDPVTDIWTQKENMPTYRTDLSGSVLDEKIYAIGGDSYGDEIMATVEVYDPATDNWTAVTDMPTARVGLRTSMVNGKIYAIGGLTLFGDYATGKVEVYNK